MNSRGQIFTLDMLFALILVTLIIGFSGQALEQITGRAEGYSARFSLERTANDAADVLVKTVGIPYNWEENVGILETLGLTEMDGFTGKPLQNNLKVGKIAQLKILCKNTNWNPSKPEVNSAMEFFGGSSNFEIRVIDGASENVLWDIWPRWDNNRPGVDNSLEVAAVRRAITVKYGEIRADSGLKVRLPGSPQVYKVWFYVGPGELDVYDWYIIATTPDQMIESVFLYVNRDTSKNYDYHYDPPSNGPESTFPKVHGGLQVDMPGRVHEGWNFINIETASGPKRYIEVYVMIVPHCTPWQNVNLTASQLGVPAVFELKLWR